MDNLNAIYDALAQMEAEGRAHKAEINAMFEAHGFEAPRTQETVE